MTATSTEPNKVVVSDDDGLLLEEMDGEKAVKLGHAFIAAGEKALWDDGRIHEEGSQP